MSLEPGRRIGAYEIVGSIGAGGMGEVYRARDSRLGRLVAIKFVSEDLAADPKAAERLAREAQLTSALNHPNIVTVHDIGEADGRPFIVMEFVAGQSLHERLASDRLKLPEAVDIACQIADGLAAAHGAGVVHRDLKPRNVMLTDDGRAKIVDFGLGKAPVTPAGADDLTVRAPGLTDEHVVLGTAGYMAPEQVSGHPIDFRVDQFALGALSYEMLTGRRAFKRDTAVQTMAAIVEGEPPPLVELCPTTPPELVTVVERCLAKDPARRYASTKDLARDLHDVRMALTTGSRSGHSPRPHPTRRSKTRWVVTALGVAAVAVLTFLFWPRSPAAPPSPTPLDEARALLVRYYKSANVDRAVELLEPGLATAPSSPAVLVTLAEAYFRKWEHTKKQDDSLLQRAKDYCSAAGALDRGSSAVHVVWAMINFAGERYDGAAVEAQQAIDLDAGNAMAWLELGLAHQQLGVRNETPQDLETAEQAFLKAVTLSQADDWRPYHFLGRFYLSTDRASKALAACQKAYGLAPDNVRVLNNLASALFLSDELDQARGIYEQSMTMEPSATAHSNLGTVLYEQHDYEDAVVQFEAAVKFPEADSRHWRNLADACHWVARLKAREREANEMAARHGEAELMTDTTTLLKARLAWTYAELGNLTRARGLVAELEHSGDESANTLYALATFHASFGDRTRALDLLARAVASGYSVARVERSPWLQALRQDERYKAIRER